MTEILLAARPEAVPVHPESRAFQIAEVHGGRVHILSVCEDKSDAAAAAGLESDVATRRGKANLGRVTTTTGEPWMRILEEAEGRGCDLIVVGPSGDRIDLKEIVFGATAERLAHRAKQPVLLVREPAERQYVHIAAATDFSEGSYRALLAAARLFPAARITLLHAFRVPFEGFLASSKNSEELRALAQRDMDAFLRERQWPGDVSDRISAKLVEADPASAIMEVDADDPIDLVVLGAHGQTGPFEKLLGGTAERLLKELSKDVMLVRESAPPS